MFHHSQLPAMPFFATSPGDEQRRIGRKRGGNHRSAGEPPRHIAAGKKELARAAARPPGVIQPNAQIEEEIQRDDRPIEQSEIHWRLNLTSDESSKFERSNRTHGKFYRRLRRKRQPAIANWPNKTSIHTHDGSGTVTFVTEPAPAPA